MRYLILESKLDKFINEFLNDIYDNLHDDTYSDFIILREPFDDEVEELGEIIMEFDYSDGRLYVLHSIINKMYSLFGLDREDAYKKVGEWFSDKFGVEISLIES